MNAGELKKVVGDSVLLSFSCGKDSIASWLHMREHGFKITPFYKALVPDLEFVDESLRFYEDFFGTHIYRTLHPTMYRWINSFCGQPPARQAAIEFLRLPNFHYCDVEDGVKRTAGLPISTWTAHGCKLADSPMRAKRLGNGINVKQRTFSPILDFRKADVVAILKRFSCPLPIDYRLFGRSWDGLDYRFLKPIKEHFPRDFARILEWFPLAGLEFHRAEIARIHGHYKETARGGRRGAGENGRAEKSDRRRAARAASVEGIADHAQH